MSLVSFGSLSFSVIHSGSVDDLSVIVPQGVAIMDFSIVDNVSFDFTLSAPASLAEPVLLMQLQFPSSGFNLSEVCIANAVAGIKRTPATRRCHKCDRDLKCKLLNSDFRL